MYTILNNRSGDNVLRLQKKTKKKTRSIWNSKQRRRKKKNQTGCKITEVFTAIADLQYQTVGPGYDEPEKDPLGLSPTRSESGDDSNVFGEEKTETAASERASLAADVDDVMDRKLPKYILVTQIPRVGAVYTCERCGRTLLALDAAVRHSCARQSQSQSQSDPDDRPAEAAVERTAGGVYSCDACKVSFTRRSQLEAHSRSHYMIESSSDECGPVTPAKRRRKTKKKKNKVIAPTPNGNDNEEPLLQSQLVRHLILSSDSD